MFKLKSEEINVKAAFYKLKKKNLQQLEEDMRHIDGNLKVLQDQKRHTEEQIDEL